MFGKWGDSAHDGEPVSRCACCELTKLIEQRVRKGWLLWRRRDRQNWGVTGRGVAEYRTEAQVAKRDFPLPTMVTIRDMA